MISPFYLCTDSVPVIDLQVYMGRYWIITEIQNTGLTDNLPPLVLKVRHLSDSAFYTGFSRLEVPEYALNGYPKFVMGYEAHFQIRVLWLYIYASAS